MFSLKKPSGGIIFSQNSQGKQSKEQLLFNSCQSDLSVIVKAQCNQSVTAIMTQSWLVYFGAVTRFDEHFVLMKSDLEKGVNP